MAKNKIPYRVQNGDTYNYLTVLEFSHTGKNYRRFYKCLCKCGIEIILPGVALTSGNTKSCGCWAKEVKRKEKLLGPSIAAQNQVISGYKCKANKAGRSFLITKEQFLTVATSPCFYCGDINTNFHKSPYNTGDFYYNGLDRIDSSKGYTMDNIVSCCKKCNFAKSDRDQAEYIEWINKSYNWLNCKKIND